MSDLCHVFLISSGNSHYPLRKKNKDSLFYPAHCFYLSNFTGALVLPLCNCYKECENTIHAV